MSTDPTASSISLFLRSLMGRVPRGKIPAVPVTIVLSCFIGILGGYGAVLFTFLIHTVGRWSVDPIWMASTENPVWLALLWTVPALGLLAVSWFTRTFAPEAQGHGVPEVITAIARNDGVIRPRVSVVKILASGICIGTGGSIGREGPIVQIGSSLGSMFGRWARLSPRHVKILVAAGAAAGISATFNAPLAGVIFASEIILGSFAVETLTPIVIASVVANVVQEHAGEHGLDPAFPHLYHEFQGAWQQLPSYFLLGLICGLAAVAFTKLLYAVEDASQRWLPAWWLRALVLGAMVGIAGALYPPVPPRISVAAEEESQKSGPLSPPLFGVGYGVVDHTLHLEYKPADSGKPAGASDQGEHVASADLKEGQKKTISLDRDAMWGQLWWLLPLALLKPLMTSLTLAGGGSGGIFAPSLYVGATVGASFGLVCNLFIPGFSADPGVYAIVGMGAVVAGTTHGTLSAILIVYEMTNDYRIILPIMVTAGLAGVVARLIDPESIYLKKLARRAESIARVHDMHRLEHIMVRNVMVHKFPTVHQNDNLTEIIRVARANSHIETLPVMDDSNKLIGIIRSADLHRVLDTDAPAHLINAQDIAVPSPISLSTNDNLLEALRDFGAFDIESLPVEAGEGKSRKVVGLLLRSDVMRRYREEMLRRR